MPKIVQMPKRPLPVDPDADVPHSLIADEFEESASLAQIKRWLEMADSALNHVSRFKKERIA